MTGSRTPDPSFWRNRRVLLTGHTGFKGAWAALWLKRLGAEIHGFALPAEGKPNLWRELGASVLDGETLADLKDPMAIKAAVSRARPQIVLHMAAQALVRPSFADPVGTIATNAMGTVNLLEALRKCDDLVTALIVTTDKVYMNDNGGRDYVESDPLGGHDPYSASKAAAEILTRSYAASYFDPAGVPDNPTAVPCACGRHSQPGPGIMCSNRSPAISSLSRASSAIRGCRARSISAPQLASRRLSGRWRPPFAKLSALREAGLPMRGSIHPK